jgi:uncharacterized membrane protein
MKKPLKVAAWSGVGIFVIGIISSIVKEILLSSGVSVEVTSIVGSPFSIVSLIFGVLFMYGFVVLADKFDGTLLKVMAWIGIVAYSLFLLFAVVGLIFSLVGLSLPALSPEVLNFSSGEEVSEFDFDFEGGEFDMEEFKVIIWEILLLVLAIWLLVAIPLSIYMVLFGVGMLKLKNDVPLAKTVGVLNIVAGATFVIFIGIFIALVAYIFEIVMFFQASNKFERKRKRK